MSRAQTEVIAALRLENEALRAVVQAHRFINIRKKHELHGLIRELVRMHGADAVHDAVVGATEGER